LPYGDGIGEVGIFWEMPEEGPTAGPSTFLVGWDGNIYMGDEQNGRVKVFDRSGNLLAVTEGRLDRIAGLGVDPQGRIFVTHGSRLDEVTVFGDGKVEKETPTSRVAQIPLREDLTQKIQEWITSNRAWLVGDVICSAERRVYLLGELSDKRDSNTIWVFDEQGQMLGHVPGRCALVDSQGRLFFEEIRWSQKEITLVGKDERGGLVNEVKVQQIEALEITIRDGWGEILEKISVKPPRLLHAQGELYMTPDLLAVDGRGHLYFHASPTTVVAKKITPALRVDGPDFVLEYDEKGDFSAVRASFYLGPLRRNFFKVDAKGNVYWLDFQADHLDVMMAPVPRNHE